MPRLMRSSTTRTGSMAWMCLRYFPVALLVLLASACAGSLSQDYKIRIVSENGIQTMATVVGSGPFGTSARAQFQPDRLQRAGWTLIGSQSDADTWSITVTRTGLPISATSTGKPPLAPGLSTPERDELAAAKRRIRELETELAIHQRAAELLKEQADPKGGSASSR
jgi:hypothetical protein